MLKKLNFRKFIDPKNKILLKQNFKLFLIFFALRLIRWKLALKLKRNTGKDRIWCLEGTKSFFYFCRILSDFSLGLSDFLGVIQLKTNHKSKIYISNDSLFSEKSFDTKSAEIHGKINCLDIFFVKIPPKIRITLRGF